MNTKLKQQTTSIKVKGNKTIVEGANMSTSHTINQDELHSFTDHINGVRLLSHHIFLCAY